MRRAAGDRSGRDGEAQLLLEVTDLSASYGRRAILHGVDLASIVALLHDLQADTGLALLFVTHNLALVRTVAGRVATLNQGWIVETGSVADVLDRPSHPCTRSLIADTPTLAAGAPAAGV